MKQRTQRNKRKISGQILQGRKNCQMKFVKSRGKRTLEKVRNANEKLRETRGGGTMRKTMEQIVLEGQVAKCRSIEELFLLWEMMQQME